MELIGNLKKGTRLRLESAGNKLALMAVTAMCSINAYAADDGGGMFATATATIRSYQDGVTMLMNAIGAVIAIVGAFNIFFKMQNGDQDVKKSIMLTIGGCIAFVALGQSLPLFFGAA